MFMVKICKLWSTLIIQTIWQGTDAFSQSGLYSNHQDIGPRYAVSSVPLVTDMLSCAYKGNSRSGLVLYMHE